MDYWAYIQTFCTTWVGVMSGLVSIILTIVGFRYTDQTLQKRAFLAAALFVFFAGNAVLWTKEHRARLNAEESRLPKFRLTIDSAAVGTFGSHTVITLLPVAYNTGAPSILSTQSLSLEMPNAASIKTRMMSSPAAVTRMFSDDGTAPRLLFSSEWFPRKAMQSPTITGASTGGWVTFVVDGVSKKDIVETATLKLLCVDVNGQPVVASKRINTIDSQQMFVPSEDELRENQSGK